MAGSFLRDGLENRKPASESLLVELQQVPIPSLTGASWTRKGGFRPSEAGRLAPCWCTPARFPRQSDGDALCSDGL